MASPSSSKPHADLRAAHSAVRVQVRRFVCANGVCLRRIFAEQFPDLAAPRARQTARLRGALQQVGLALGGRAGARLSGKLAMPVSGKTVLHLLQHLPLPSIDPPRVVGIDDWAWRRGHRYGTILCDLERHRLVDLLPDRSADTVAIWFETQPEITIIARDRGGLYADGASRGAPTAIQSRTAGISWTTSSTRSSASCCTSDPCSSRQWQTSL